MLGGTRDRLLLGPSRRRRRLTRRLRALDRLDAVQSPGRHPRSGAAARHTRTLLVAGLTACFLLGVAAVGGAGVVPVSLRNLVHLGPHPLGRPPTVTGSGSFAFMAHQPGAPDDPVSYDPCQPIHVRLNPAGGPAGSRRMVLGAMHRVARATGLHFVYDGTSTQRPHWQTPMVPTLLGRREPVLVSFASAREVTQLRGRVVGIGGSVAVADDAGVEHYATGEVTLDTSYFDTLTIRAHDRALGEAIVMHEFGHVVGLAHVHDPRELMNPTNLGLTRYGPGDLEGLAKLGAGRCF